MHPHFVHALGCAAVLVAFVGCGLTTVTAEQLSGVYKDSVDLDAGRKAFGCDAPADAVSKRACKAVDAFEQGGKVESYPSEGAKVYLSRSDCSKDPKRFVLEVTGLEPGTPPGKVEEAHRAPGVIKYISITIFVNEKMGVAEDFMRRLEAGESSPGLTEQQVKADTFPESWAGWREEWREMAKHPLPTAQSDGKSLLEQPGMMLPAAFWRESEGALIRIQPPTGEGGEWCVNHYFLLPE